jgi:hypothetical protein
VKHVADDVRQDANRAENADQRPFTADIDEVDFHQRIPGCCEIRVDDGCHCI